MYSFRYVAINLGVLIRIKNSHTPFIDLVNNIYMVNVACTLTLCSQCIFLKNGPQMGLIFTQKNVFS
jgi:hypothetical protein